LRKKRCPGNAGNVTSELVMLISHFWTSVFRRSYFWKRFYSPYIKIRKNQDDYLQR